MTEVIQFVCVFTLTLPHQLLNHPHLSAHIDETDEDALSYMTDLEVGNARVVTKSGKKHFLPHLFLTARSFLFLSDRDF